MPDAYSDCIWFRKTVTLSKIAHYVDTPYIAAACVGFLLMADIELNPKRLKLFSRLQGHQNPEINHNFGLVDCFEQFKSPRIVI